MYFSLQASTVSADGTGWPGQSQFKYSEAKDSIRVQKNLRGSKTMTGHDLRWLMILMLGAWLGACTTPSSQSPTSLPTPETSTSADARQEDSDRPPDEQAGQPPQDPSGPAQNPGDPEASTPEPHAPARTSDEEVAVLDQQLEDALGHYDEQIHREFEKAQAERHTHGQASAGDEQEAESEWDPASTMDPATPAEESYEARAETRTRSPSAESGESDLESEPRAGDSRDRGVHSTPPPADIPSGDDDDVVARQLREAAQKERDPELRDKLWDEYRKYKKQQASLDPSPAEQGE